MKTIVIALGGNALGNDPLEQQEKVKTTVTQLIPFIKEGYQMVLGHGNGPQVGIINLAFEDSYENTDIPYMPFPECTAMSQGYIGYHLQKGLREVLAENGICKDVVTIVTEMVVDPKDPAFQNPTKPIGPFYTKKIADLLMKQTGEKYIEDAGRGYRKVVASPKPLSIVEGKTIENLMKEGYIVIACGGGGIPIFNKATHKKANAVIDKDLACALMAEKVNADILLIATNVAQAKKFYGTDKEENIGRITVSKALEYIKEGHFAKGSMLPKIEAAISFVQKTGGRAIITSLDHIENALVGNDVTEIIP